MNNETSFNRIDHMKKFARRGIVFGALLGIACLAVPILHVSALTFEEPLRKEQAAPLGPQVKPGAASEPISTIQLNPTGRAVAAPAGETIYITRYLPDIIKGAKGPAEMVFLFYKYLMGLVGIVAVGVIMYGGVLRTVSASQQKVTQSNAMIKNALSGIILLFGAQVLFNTINPNIIDIGRIQRIIQPKERIVPGVIKLTDITVYDEEGVFTSVGKELVKALSFGTLFKDHKLFDVQGADTVREALSSAGVRMLPECKPGGTTKGCISLIGAHKETIGAAASMAEAGIPIQITSVTEGQHAAGTYSHASGYKWDMAPIPESNFSSKPDRFEKIATRSDSTATYRDKATGAECSLEKPPAPAHWDCSVRPDAQF